MPYNYASSNSDCENMSDTLHITGIFDLNTSGCTCVSDPYCLSNWDWTLKKIGLCKYANIGYECEDTYPIYVNLEREKNTPLFRGFSLSGISWLLEIRCNLTGNSNVIWRGRLVSKNPHGNYSRIYGCDNTSHITVEKPVINISSPGSASLESDVILNNSYSLVVSNFNYCSKQNGIFRLTAENSSKNLFYDYTNPKWQLLKVKISSIYYWLIISQDCFFYCNDGNYQRNKPFIWKQNTNSSYPTGNYSLLPLSNCFEWNSDLFNNISLASLTVGNL